MKINFRRISFLLLTVFGMLVGFICSIPVIPASSNAFEQGYAHGKMHGDIIAIPVLSFIIIQIVKIIKKQPEYSFKLFSILIALFSFNKIIGTFIEVIKSTT